MKAAHPGRPRETSSGVDDKAIRPCFEAVGECGSITVLDPTSLDLTTFSTPVDVRVRRQQNEIGVNYWFTPRRVAKVAYQISLLLFTFVFQVVTRIILSMNYAPRKGPPRRTTASRDGLAGIGNSR
jgi:hypothetical protein